MFYSGNVRIDQLFQKQPTNKDIDPSIAAETKMVMLLVQHNSFFNISNHLCPLIRDDSNDNGLEKMFPVTVRIYDVNFGRVLTKFLDMNLLEGREASTADAMFESIDKLLDRNSIDWS